MTTGKSFTAMLIVAGGLAAVTAAPAAAVNCGAFTPSPSYTEQKDFQRETPEERQAREAKRLAQREARKAARAAKKAERENAAAAAVAAPATVASN